MNGGAVPARRRADWAAISSHIWPYALAIVICLAVLIKIYELYKVDLRVPLDSYGDGLFYQALFKNFIETGNYNINPRLGAPGQLELYDFPVPHSTHLLGFALLRLFSHDFGLVFNLYYLASFPLAAIVALYVFRRFKISAGLAVALAVLYAFLPYHILRSELQYILACYYLVPLAVLVALWLATGVPLFVFRDSWVPRPTRDGIIALLSLVLIAGDNPYYAFFAGLFVICGGLLGHFRYRIRHTIFTTIILAAVLTGAFLLNTAPNFAYFYKHGSNPIAARDPGDVETYGLKIIQLLAPVTDHRIARLAAWKRLYNLEAPLVNENEAATLGIIGSIGFIILLGVFFAPRTSQLIYSAAVLNLSSVLFGTIGGIASVFAFAIWQQYRSVNRISIFIGFLCFLALGIGIDGLAGKSRRRRIALYWLLPAPLVVIGLADQIPSVVVGYPNLLPASLRYPHSVLEAQARDLRFYFSRIEASVPSGSMIYQLPYIPFPLTRTPNKLGAYEELLPYLYSKAMRWSHASMGGRQADHWNEEVGNEPIPKLVETTAAAGFAGILVDRNAYADQGGQLEEQLSTVIQERPVISANKRYAFFPLSTVANALKSRYDSTALDELANPLFAGMETGCWPLENDETNTWNWCGSTGELVLDNPSKETQEMTVAMTIRTDTYDPPADVTIHGPGIDTTIKANTSGTLWKETLRLPPGRSVYVLSSNAPPVAAPKDPRRLIMSINNLKISPAH